MTIREWWGKSWAKNLVFFGIMSLLFFTEIGTWVQVEFTRWRLDAPQYIESKAPSQTLYRYDIRIEDVNGEVQSLSEFKGKPVFLNMWASWCVPCIAELPSLEDLQASLPELTFVFLNFESKEVFDRFVASSKFEVPYYRVTTPLPGELTPKAIPASYILDADGQVIYQFTGAADWANPKVAEQIKKLLE